MRLTVNEQAVESLRTVLSNADLMSILIGSATLKGILGWRETGAYTDTDIEIAAQILAGQGLMARIDENAFVTQKGRFYVENGWPTQP